MILLLTSMKNILDKINLLIVLVSICFFSCSRKDDFLCKSKTINNIRYQINYLPDYAAKSLSMDSVELADLLYYKFTISDESGSNQIRNLFDPSNYNKLLFYINGSIQNDFQVENDIRVFQPVQVFFESNNRLANKLVFLLAFEKEKKTDYTTIVFNDNILNNGILKFNYKTADLNTL